MKPRHLIDGLFFGVTFTTLVLVVLTHRGTLRHHFLTQPVGAVVIGLGILSGTMLVDVLAGRRAFRGKPS